MKVTQVVFPQKPQRRKRVAAYARVSSGKDAMMQSLATQVGHYSRLIQDEPKWEYMGVYADEAKTGTKDAREEFQRLIADCREGKIDLILTKSISRFARNTVTLLKTVRELKNIGVEVYFEEDGISTFSAEGELILTFLATHTQEQSRVSSERFKWRIRAAFEEGKLINMRHMFGYIVTKDLIKINPQTAPIVREIFGRVIADESYSSIAKELNRRHITGVLGGEWNSQRIVEIITNEKYAGDYLTQKHYKNNYLEKKKKKNNGELPQNYFTEALDAIVDHSTFEAANIVYKRRREQFFQNTTPQTHSVFTGKIKCPKCGKNYRKVTNKGKIGWNCSTFIKQGKSVCHGKQIPDDILKETVTKALKLRTFVPEKVASKLAGIIVPGPNRLILQMMNGSEIETNWESHSRSESWTTEMKNKARKKELLRRSVV